MKERMEQGAWYFCPDYGQYCQVIEVQTIWGETTCRVWFPGTDSMVSIPFSCLKFLESEGSVSPYQISYVAAAARVVDALTQNVLLAPLESSVTPLPHQIRALSKAMSNDRVRYLLADEVGLGKTIEAGLIMRELKLRGLVKRTLVVAPKGLVSQWVAEMNFHFGENFQSLLPDDLKTLKRILPAIGSFSKTRPNQRDLHSNAWQMFSQVVVPMDSIKPLDKRRGWTPEQVQAYNRERFEDLIFAGWDLVIVDEAHRLGGSTDQVARFRLGQGLSESAPYFLMLSATPHQGKTDAFHRLFSLIDAREFSESDTMTQERVKPYVIRTEKRLAIDADGKTLFKPRRTQLALISWEDRQRSQKLLYDAVTEYVREGYNQSIRENRKAIGFLMILMQRLVVSSTRAIRTTLSRRLEALNEHQEDLVLLPLSASDEDWSEMDGQEQLENLLQTRLKALKNERAEVKRLLEAAVRCEQEGPDAKALALLNWIYTLQAEEGEPDLKILVFTEFVPTQEMLRQFLNERGFSVVCLNGSLDMEERKSVQKAFSEDVRILVSTDAGGEGLNLQFCHVVINYDIPWNPMRIEQRIGRVDRIGQKHIVRALNFIFEDSVEYRVREVLEEKLARIFEEFGIDKTGDVLDSIQAGQMYDEMFVEAILNPEKIEKSVDKMVVRIEEQAREARSVGSMLGGDEVLEPGEAKRLLGHPLSFWIERMTLSYVKGHGGLAEKTSQGWTLTWPDGEVDENVVFSANLTDRFPYSSPLTLEDPKVRALTLRLPRFVQGPPIPVVFLPEISKEIRGFWSLWRIAISGEVLGNRRILPIFLADNNMVYMPTARHVWDHLLGENIMVRNFIDFPAARTAVDGLKKAAEEHGKPLYESLVHENQLRLTKEREKIISSFASRRKATDRIGLPQVRNYRLNMIDQEERTCLDQLDQRSVTSPELLPLIVIRVEGGGHG